MSTIISLASQKGGVAKSASAVNLAIGLAREGNKVLLLDTDPQSSTALSFGYKPDELPITLATIMGKIIEGKTFDPSEGIIHHQEQSCSIDFDPATKQLSGIEASLSSVMGKEQILKEYLDRIKDQYDFVGIDTPPWLGTLTINALVASEKVIVPVQANYLSLMGMEKLFETIVQVKRWFNQDNSGQPGPNYENRRPNDIVAEEAGESVKQIQRYIRLTELIPPMLPSSQRSGNI